MCDSNKGKQGVLNPGNFADIIYGKQKFLAVALARANYISTMHPAPSADRGGELRQLVPGAAAVAAVEPHRVPRVGQGRPGKQLRHPVKD